MHRPSEKISFHAAVALLFSLVELVIPRPLPFMKLGLSNIPLLLALGTFSFPEYLALAFLKALSASFISGTMFSFFLLLSLLQSLAAAIVMYFCYKAGGSLISRYGISLSGALASTLTQGYAASLYLGKGILSLLPVMLAVALPSALVTAYISYRIELPQQIPQLPQREEKNRRRSDIATMVILLCTLLVIPMLESIYLLAAGNLVLCLMMLSKGRRLKITPYLSLLLISLFSAILTPRGEVLLYIFSFPITRDAIIIGLRNYLVLSSTLLLSLLSRNNLSSFSLISDILSYFARIESSWRTGHGSLWNRFNTALKMENATEQQKSQDNISIFTLLCILGIYCTLLIINNTIF